jgi:hypothetical protein
VYRFLLPFLFAGTLVQAQPKISADVVVYGGTAGGVMSAIAAAREGASVLLIEPGKHLGGMLTGGLSHTDYGDRAVIGGLALDFYRRVAKLYNSELYFWRGPEPTIGENLLKEWLKEGNVKVVYNERVKSVSKVDKAIQSLQTLSGKTFTGKVFVDATYEGDLFARAGVSYAIGRESVDQYGESWAGRQPFRPDGHTFHFPVSPFRNGKEGELLPLINGRPMVAVGQADSGVQAYCFRLIMTNNPANRVAITRPADYDPARYELLRRYLKIRKPTTLRETGVIGPHINLPNQKAEINSGGPISTNLYDGSNWPYPDADYPLRDKIWNDHLSYTKGLLYFISNDPSVPENIRNEAKQWGLAKDEFADTDYYPHQLYVRVARRMIGEYVLTQHDLMKDVIKYDAIGMGSYNIDVRHIQRNWEWVSRFPELKGETYNEGYLSIPVLPYQIPYRSLVPKYQECSNLLVPVCISSSNLAYASFRMEPQYMIAGHAAGVAAAMASKNRVAVQMVDVAALQNRLLQQGQIVSMEENPNGFFQQGNTVIVDDDESRFVEKWGAWSLSENPDVKRHQITYYVNTDKEPAWISYQPHLPRKGTYNVYGWWAKDATAATNVPVKIEYAGGSKTIRANQQHTGDGWVLLGSFPFDAGQKGKLTLSNEGVDGTVAADAFKFEWIK